MENANRWYYTKDQLATTPSRKCDIDQPKELSYRQQAANFIQDMGQRLQLSQLCINTAIVYMHRFYVYHSFTEVHRNNLSISALFLAAKVEEQPRKLEHVIKVAHVCLHKDAPALDVRTEAYAEKAQEVVFHENILLQTLGFVLAIEHPHTYVVKVCQLVKASKDLAQSSYLMATTSLHMTTMCIQYKPTVVACVCIHLACKWSSYLIEPCSEGREWFYYVDRTVTLELLEKLTQDFIAILETSPHRFKKKFGGKETVGYHNPKAIIENAAKEAKEASASEKKNGISIKKEPSPGPSTSLSFDFCPDFDDKHVKFDKGPDYEHNNNRVPELVGVKKPPVMTVSRKVPEAKPEPKKFPEVDIAKKIQQDMDSKKALLNVEKVIAETKVVVENKVNADEVHASDSNSSYLAYKKTYGIDDIKKPVPPPAYVPMPKAHVNMDPTVRIKKEPGLEHSIVAMSSEKRNGLSPITDPSPVPSPFVPSPFIPGPVKMEPVENNDVHVSSKRSSESSHRHREKHKSKHSSRDRHNHSPPASIKVKIRKDIIPSLLKGHETAQLESPKPSLKIKLPKPPGMVTPEPPRPDKPSLPKLVITKGKSGSGLYSTSHKNESSNRKRSHDHKNSHNEVPPSKYPKVNHSSHKSSRHEKSHRESKTTFQQMPSYSNYGALPPPPMPNFVGGYVMNNMQLQPPLPPERQNIPPPPPLPPPE